MGKWIPVGALFLLMAGVWYEAGFPAARPYAAALFVCLCVIAVGQELHSNGPLTGAP